MQTHASYLSHHLARRGYAVEVVTYQPAGREERLATTTLDHRLPFPVHRELSRLAYWHNVDTLARRARTFGADLIYCSTVFYGWLRDLLAVPVVARSVGNDVMRPWIVYPFRPVCALLANPELDDRMYRFFRRFDYPELLEVAFRDKRCELMRASARRLDRILANSDFTANLLRQAGVDGARVQVLVGGVESGRFEPPTRRRGPARERRAGLGIDPDAYVLTTACRLVAKKGVDFLLPAFVGLRRSMPDAHLLVIGEGRHERRYRKQAHELGLDGHVTFAGRVEHAGIHHYLWMTDLFVLASRVQIDPTTGLRDAETMGRVLCEANAAGVPTVAARSGGIPSVVTDGGNGLLFEPDDAGDLLEQVTRLRYDRTLRSRMVANGRRLARERFDWSVIVAAHERMFAEVLGESVAAA